MGKIIDTTATFPMENVMLVDSLNLAFRWKHRNALVFAQEYVDTVKSFARSYQAGTVIILADWGGSTYRKEVYPEYKQNRKDLKDKQTEKEAADFRKFFEEYENTLEALDEAGFTVFRYKGVEADDLAAYIVSRLEDYGFDQAWLISSDRDWDLLVRENVHRFSYVTRKEQTLETWDNPVPPEQYISFKCLTGDKGDNVPGIPGIGPKRAADLINQYGSAMDIYDACPIDSHYKYVQNLNENAEQILINYELMDLVTFCEEAIGRENINDIGRRLINV